MRGIFVVCFGTGAVATDSDEGKGILRGSALAATSLELTFRDRGLCLGLLVTATLTLGCAGLGNVTLDGLVRVGLWLGRGLS